MITITISDNDAGQRTDRFLRKYLTGAPLGAIYRIIRKDLKVNGKRVHKEDPLRPGDVLTLYLSQEDLEEFRRPVRKRAAAPRQFRVIYEDDQVLIVSKPAGLLVHGDSREKRNTLINQVCGYLQDRGEYEPGRDRTFTPAPANRIDRNTSGLVVFGKTAAAMRALTRLIREREGIRKEYLAIAAGTIRDPMTLTDRLIRDRDRSRVTATTDGKAGEEAETRIRPLKSGRDFTLVEAELITGRTHQIRVHLASAGHPILGDPKYGDPGLNKKAKKYQTSGQLLHAHRLSFGELDQPLRKLSNRRIEAEPPAGFTRAVEELIHGRQILQR